MCNESKATVLCEAHKAYFCDTHGLQHAYERGEHSLSKIDNALSEESWTQLEAEINTRIRAINAIKIEVTRKTADIINKIEETCNSSIDKLDQEIFHYAGFIRYNDFNNEALEWVRMILNIGIIEKEGIDVNIFVREKNDNGGIIRKADIEIKKLSHEIKEVQERIKEENQDFVKEKQR
jgi:gas vesicle protein